jgi:hypothetical protein
MRCAGVGSCLLARQKPGFARTDGEIDLRRRAGADNYSLAQRKPNSAQMGGAEVDSCSLVLRRRRLVQFDRKLDAVLRQRSRGCLSSSAAAGLADGMIEAADAVVGGQVADTGLDGTPARRDHDLESGSGSRKGWCLGILGLRTRSVHRSGWSRLAKGSRLPF